MISVLNVTLISGLAHTSGAGVFRFDFLKMLILLIGLRRPFVFGLSSRRQEFFVRPVGAELPTWWSRRFPYRVENGTLISLTFLLPFHLLDYSRV